MGKRLCRSRTERVVWGVCGGLGQYFNIDPVLVRVIFIVLTLVSGVGPGIIAYIIMAIVIPPEGSISTPRESLRENVQEMKKSAEDLGREIKAGIEAERKHHEHTHEQAVHPPVSESHRGRDILGIVLIIVGVIFLLSTLKMVDWPRWLFLWAFFWPVLLIVIGLIIVFALRRR